MADRIRHCVAVVTPNQWQLGMMGGKDFNFFFGPALPISIEIFLQLSSTG